VFAARLHTDPLFRIAPVHRRTFGSFVEHMGRCVYTGIYEPGHPRADADGLRRDVLDLVRELGVTTVRYPGGNFVSNYRWEDGVGPVQQRPRRLDLAWHGIETNEFGLHEFDHWAKAAGVEPMMAVNLGTRGLTEAVDLLEYANHPGGTQLSDLRVAHGAKDPFGIRMWCLGNEMDGPWQVGHKDADAYGRLAAETAKAMRFVDASLELVVCGSSNSHMPTFGAWEASVLEHAYEYVDYISCHDYYEPRDGDLTSFLASAVDMDGFIEAVVATADHVRAKKRSKKRIAISFDEWNVWYNDRFVASGGEQDWQVAPRVIEDEYNVADAVVVGGLLISLLRHSDRVTAASLAQLVNVIAPIRSEPGGPAWRQTTFHPFALTARHAAGTVLTTLVETQPLETKRHGEVPAVDAVVTHDADQGALTVFAVNRNPNEGARLELDLRPFPGYRGVQHIVLTEPDLTLTNTMENPDRVVPRDAGRMTEAEGMVTAVLPPASWNMLRLAERP
jgi:alpha-N-arabinofuranosidase